LLASDRPWAGERRKIAARGQRFANTVHIFAVEIVIRVAGSLFELLFKFFWNRRLNCFFQILVRLRQFVRVRLGRVAWLRRITRLRRAFLLIAWATRWSRRLRRI